MPEMEHGISELQEAIAGACRMDLAAKSENPLVMLSSDLRKGFSKEKQKQIFKEKQKQSSYWFRVQQAMWLLHRDTCAAADALRAKYRLTMCDPQGGDDLGSSTRGSL